MGALTKTPLCGETFPDGECIDGWVTAPDVDATIVRRCDCRLVASPTQRKQRGMRSAEAAHPGQSKAARQIVRDAAYLHERFSANDLLALFAYAQVTSQGIPGRAFTAVAEEGLIVRTDDRVKSEKPGTNDHEIYVWESRVFGTERSSAAGLLTGQAR